MFYEINKAEKYHSIIYGYFSAILHRQDKDIIIENLEKNGRTEQEILNVIAQDFGSYEILNEQYKNNIKFENLNTFEKIIYAREEARKTNKGKIIKDELSNIVHLNLAYAVCLNPYKYNYFSKYVYEYLTNDKNLKL